MVDTIRQVVVTLAIVGLAWWTLVPRGWLKDCSLGERRVLLVFLPVRLVLMPLVFHAVGMASRTLFSGGTDADFYDQSGRDISQDLIGNLPLAQPGTGVMRYSVGVFYWLAGPNRIAATFLWAALGTIGILLFWLAAREFVPSRRVVFGALMLLMPSTLFWSAGLGKEALMMLGIGCLMMGFAKMHVYARMGPALAYALVGAIITGLTRPHITLIVLIALIIGSLAISPRMSKATLPQRLAASAATLLLLGVAFALSLRLMSPEPGESWIDLFYRRADFASDQGGGSAFVALPVRSLNDIPTALGTVLLRPWPWEATTIAQFAVVAESLLMVGLLLWAIMLVITRRAYVVWSPMLAAALTYIVLFSIALSSYGNFGLLARQRVQVAGFLLVVVFSLRLIQDRRKTSTP